MTALEQLGVEPETTSFDLITEGAGQVALAETVDPEAAHNGYIYEVTYGEDGRINGARSWTHDAEAGETTFVLFDTAGRQVSRVLTSEPLGMELHYDGKDNLTYSAHRYNDGKTLERYWYGSNGLPTSSIHIDLAANTQTITLHQPTLGDWVRTTQYQGAEGWLGSPLSGIDNGKDA